MGRGAMPIRGWRSSVSPDVVCAGAGASNADSRADTNTYLATYQNSDSENAEHPHRILPIHTGPCQPTANAARSLQRPLPCQP